MDVSVAQQCERTGGTVACATGVDVSAACRDVAVRGCCRCTSAQEKKAAALAAACVPCNALTCKATETCTRQSVRPGVWSVAVCRAGVLPSVQTTTYVACPTTRLALPQFSGLSLSVVRVGVGIPTYQLRGRVSPWINEYSLYIGNHKAENVQIDAQGQFFIQGRFVNTIPAGQLHKQYTISSSYGPVTVDNRIRNQITVVYKGRILTKSPVVYATPVCGNGFVEGNEACENNVTTGLSSLCGGKACSQTCQCAQ